MEAADDRGGVSFRLRAFLPLLICFAFLFVGIAWLYHSSRARSAQIAFTVNIEGTPVGFYSATLNGAPYGSGRPCGLGSKIVRIEVPNAEPFQTNVFVWYSGIDFGVINLPRSTGTLLLEVAPGNNKISIRGERFEKEIANCTSESLIVPVGTYDVATQFEYFGVAERAVVRRNAITTVAIRPSITTAVVTSDPAESEFQLESRRNRSILVQGRTPAVIQALPSGTFHLSIWRGKFRKDVPVVLRNEPTNTVNVTFDYAKVAFKSDPEEAHIRHGDEKLGETPALLSLIPGSYQITIERAG